MSYNGCTNKFCFPLCVPHLLEQEHKTSVKDGALIRLPTFSPQDKENISGNKICCLLDIALLCANKSL